MFIAGPVRECTRCTASIFQYSVESAISTVQYRPRPDAKNPFHQRAERASSEISDPGGNGDLDEDAGEGADQADDAAGDQSNDGGEEGCDDANHDERPFDGVCGAPDGFAFKMDVTPTQRGIKHVHGYFPPNR